jgi:hypothetical protein
MEERKGMGGKERKHGSLDGSAKRLFSMKLATKLSPAMIDGGRGE